MLLAIDTASQVMGAALYDGNEVLAESEWHTPNYHSTQLAPLISQLFEWSSSSITDLQAVAIALGPGGFTGLRVGLALSKGICLATHARILGVPALHAIAVSQPLPPVKPARLAAVLQAGRGRLAVGWYEAMDAPQPVLDTQALFKAWRCSQVRYEIITVQQLMERINQEVQAKPETCGITLVCGEINAAARQYIFQQAKQLPANSFYLASAAHSQRRASFLAELAWHRLQNGDVDDPASLAPIYLQG